MHEYTYYGRGNTIHSHGQIEWFQINCDDKSFHVGGKQDITFLDEYATPHQCRTGLMYMNLLGNPTDADLNTFPHVLLIGPHEWDPSVLDYTHPPTAADPTWAPDPSQHGAHDRRIDELGNFKGIVRKKPHFIPLATPTLFNTNMPSQLNPLILRNSGTILAGATNTQLRKPSTKPLNGLLPPLGIL